MNSDQKELEERIQADVDQIIERGLPTQETYREVCALLFWNYERRPTANMLYQYVRKGSMSAPANALRNFWAVMRAKSSVRIEHPDLPEEVRTAAGAAIGEIWRLATEQAQAAAKVQNEEVIAQLDAAEASRQTLKAALDAGHQHAADLLRDLDAEREAHQATQQSRDTALQVAAAKDQQAANAREETHRLRQALADAQAQHAQQLLKLSQEAAEKADRAQAAAKAERDRLMLELDVERTTSKTSTKELERVRAIAAEVEAKLRQDLSAHADRILALQQKASELEGANTALRQELELQTARMLGVQEKAGELEGANTELRAQREAINQELTQLRAAHALAKPTPSRKRPGSAEAGAKGD